MASMSAVQAFRETFVNPEQPVALSQASRKLHYSVLWSYYTNSAFEEAVRWQSYRQTFGLYRYTRSIYNPTQRIVDFYVNHVYPGVLSEDGARLPAGVQLAIPLADDTDEKLRAAIAQFWQWSNWQEQMATVVTYAGVTGSAMAELQDDLARAKVTASVIWPGHVAEIELDDTGNVKSYALEYEVLESDARGMMRPYLYRKEVDSESFRFFKDDSPFDYDGQGAEYANPYGFVPAVWFRHINQGSEFGAPAIRGSIGKIDELNSLASHIVDDIHKQINNPVIIGSAGRIVSLFKQSAKANEELAESDTSGRQATTLLKGDADVKVERLSGNLNLADAIPYVESLIAEIEHDFPELTFYRELRQMSQVTGPAAARLTGDVGAKVLRAQAGYDQQSIKLFQMAVAIAGWRLSRGDYGGATAQQRKFAGFDLASYERGELDFAIMPRPLVPLTEGEQIANDKARADMVNAKADFIDEQQALTELGYNEEQVAEIQKRRRSVDVIPRTEQ